MEKQRTVLSIKDLIVKFRVHGQTLTAIRNISLDIFDGETIAIVGESGSGKSVFTKTFTDMIDDNGYIANGSIDYYPEASNDKHRIVEPTNLVEFHRNNLSLSSIKKIKKNNKKIINETYKEIKVIESKNVQKSQDKISDLEAKIKRLESNNKRNKNQYKINVAKNILDEEKSILSSQNDGTLHEDKIEDLTKKINKLKQENIYFKQDSFFVKTKINQGMKLVQDLLNKKDVLGQVKKYYEEFLLRTNSKTLTVQQMSDLFKEIIDEKHDVTAEDYEFLKETWDLEKRNKFIKKINANKNLKKLRGGTIATIFQDPMTSLNPLLSVGYQIIEAIRAHKDISVAKAKKEAVDLLTKVGIPDPETRMKDIPGKYSGGMRQRIVIAIALACQPKVLICDEPTTALDVTIQAQILKLIKDIKDEFNLTVIFITHDLGVVANIADRVVVLYAGQILEYGKTNEIFYDPKHPYTWALLSSLPQLGKKGEPLYAINGTPPSLYSDIKGDPFAPRNRYALEVDYLYQPPFFKVSDTHFAKSWLLDKRAPKIEKPEILKHLREIINQ